MRVAVLGILSVEALRIVHLWILPHVGVVMASVDGDSHPGSCDQEQDLPTSCRKLVLRVRRVRTCRHSATILERQRFRRHASDVGNRWMRAQTLLDAHRQVLELAHVAPADDVTVGCHVEHFRSGARLVLGMCGEVVEDPRDTCADEYSISST